jgi:hypothetical protein
MTKWSMSGERRLLMKASTRLVKLESPLLPLSLLLWTKGVEPPTSFGQ